MPLLAIAVGLVSGLGVWLVMDPIQTNALREIFQSELRSRAQIGSHEDLIRFEHYVEHYEATTHLLAHQRRIIDYLMFPPWEYGNDQGFAVLQEEKPDWLPAASFWTPLVRPSHVILFDDERRMREIFGAVNAPIPDELRQHADLYLGESALQGYLTTLDEGPYYLVTRPVEGVPGRHLGYIMLLVPIDERFLRASQEGALKNGTVLAVLDADEQRILASSQPEVVFADSLVDIWKDGYMITAQSFFDYDGSDLNMQFATFTPTSELVATNQRVLQLERRQRLVAAAVFIAVYTLVIVLVSARLNMVARRLARFTQRALGYAEPAVRGRNQLLLLEDWINRFTRMVLVSRDEMSSRYKTEVQDKEALRTAVMGNARDCIVTVDNNGKIIDFNPTAERTFGHRREQVIGRDVHEVLVAKSDVDRFWDMLKHSCHGWDAQPFGLGDEIRALRADGREFPAELSIMRVPLASRTVFTVWLHDISTRRRVEQEIESLAKFASESPSPILRVNDRGVVLYANAASQPLLEYWDCEPGQTLPHYWRNLVLAALENKRQEEPEMVSGGRVYSLLLAPVVSLAYVNIYGRDITEVRHAEQQARQHQAELVHVCRLSTMGEMSTGMAHELNQPLSAIVNFAKGSMRRLRSGTYDEKTILDALEQVASQAERAGEIIRRLRNLVTRQPPVRTEVDLNGLVREVCSFVEYEARKLAIDIELLLSPEELPVRVDLVQIEQVLLNLLRNAMDALQTVPASVRSLVVRTSAYGHGQVQMSVYDSGPGINPEHMANLFNPFFTTKSTGMGMGLPISKTIIDDHQGTISARSTPDRGTVFTVILPTYLDVLDSKPIAGTG